MFSLCAVFTALAMAAPLEPPADVLAAEARRVAVMDAARKATVSVFGSKGEGGGSGVIISADGYTLSNYHVTSAAGDWMRCGLSDGKLYDAVIVGIDPVGDVALLKLLGREDFPVAPLGDSDKAKVGDWVFASGNPFLLATDFQPTVTYGIISGVNRYQYPEGTLLEYADCIQTDAAINPGNSGGPLFDAAGNVIGINGRGSFEKRGRVNVGVGYAISINQIKRFLGQLRAGRIVDHATLGATVTSDEQGRPRVDGILETSDAYRRGLRYDDVVESLAGKRVRSANALKNILGSHPAAWRVPLVYRRGERRFETMVRLATVHREAELLALLAGGALEGPPEDEPKGKPDEERGEPKPPAPGIGKLLEGDKMPPHVAARFEQRRGFANYHFNRVERQRVWSKLAGGGDFAATGEVWRVAGELAGGGKAAFELRPDEGLADLPAALSRVRFDGDLAAALDPAGSGGLLAALHLWQRLLRLGPEKFGQVTYWGTAPLAGESDLCDVLVGVHAGVLCRFYVSVAGDLAAVEMFPGEGYDPCEVYFADYRSEGAVRMPHKITIRHGNETFAEVAGLQWSFQK